MGYRIAPRMIQNRSVKKFGKDTSDGPTTARRLLWVRPILNALSTQDAETGVNSTTDATVTFS